MEKIICSIRRKKRVMASLLTMAMVLSPLLEMSVKATETCTHQVDENSIVYEWEEVDSTEEGKDWSCKATYTCETCHKSITDKCKVELTEEEAPTCTEDGKKVYTAIVEINGKTYTAKKEISIPALGHDMEEVEEKEATCTEAGNIAHKKCSRCEYRTDSEENEIAENSWIVPSKGHNLDKTGKITVQPTSTKSGMYTYNVCKNGCGKKTEVKLPQKQITVTMGKTYYVPTNSAYKMSLVSSSKYSKYLKFNSTTGKIWTTNDTKYFKSLKSATIKVTVANGSTYNIKINYKIPTPSVSKNFIKKTTVGKSYKYKFNYNFKYATKVKVRIIGQESNKKLNKVLD